MQRPLFGPPAAMQPGPTGQVQVQGCPTTMRLESYAIAVRAGSAKDVGGARVSHQTQSRRAQLDEVKHMDGLNGS